MESDMNMEYPKMRYHPDTGEAIRANSTADDKPEYLDYHPKDPDAKVKVKASELAALQAEKMAEAEASGVAEEPSDLTDDEVVDALVTGNIPFDASMAKDEKRALLISALQQAVTDRGGVPPVQATAKLLLQIVQG